MMMKVNVVRIQTEALETEKDFLHFNINFSFMENVYFESCKSKKKMG